ncbi:SigE family RNA polymerase sigma factor [Embleya sp. NPDC001921]
MDAAAQERFAEFARGRRLSLTRFAYTLTMDVGRAEDLVQEALFRLWNAWRGSTIEQPEAYVRRILVNLAIGSRRRKWWGEVSLGWLPQRSEEAHLGGVHSVDDRDELRRALAKLPSGQRVVLILRYVEDMADSQVAELLGCSEGAVRSQAARGLARLRADPTFARYMSPSETAHGLPESPASRSSTSVSDRSPDRHDPSFHRR